MIRAQVLVLALPIALIACSKGTTPPLPYSPPASASSATMPGAPAEPLPPGHPPMGDMPPGHPPMGAAPGAGSAGGDAAASPKVTFTTPSTWVAETPSSSMRLAQYRVSRTAGDNQDAAVVVFWFGGGGGSIEANLERWYGQFTQPDGRPSREAAIVTKGTAGGMALTRVELGGAYSGQMGPGAPPAGGHQAGHRMVAAVLETPEGLLFVRLLGPEKTVRAATPSFDAYVTSAKKP
ncbi:MAG: hypothetical protein AABZ30_08045 [Myxococcota bacterium]